MKRQLVVITLVTLLAPGALDTAPVRAAQVELPVRVDNSLGNHAAEGSIVAVHQSSVRVRVHNGNHFWTNFAMPTPSGGVVSVPSPTLNGLYAQLGAIGPDGDAEWDIAFAGAPGTQDIQVSPSKTLSPRAGVLNVVTVVAAFLGEAPHTPDIATFKAAIEPLFGLPHMIAAIDAIEARDPPQFAWEVYGLLSDSSQRLVLLRALKALGINASEQLLKSLLRIGAVVDLAHLALAEGFALLSGRAEGIVSFTDVPLVAPGKGLFVVATTDFYGDDEPGYVGVFQTDGHEVYSITYQPIPHAQISENAAHFSEPTVRVAANRRIFFAERDGTIHAADPFGLTHTVTRVPVPDGPWEISFAISPDGRRLLIATVQYQPLVPIPDCNYGIGCRQFAVGPFRYRLYHAYVGGAAELLQSVDGTLDVIARQPLPIGWTVDSPIALTQRRMGTQQSDMGVTFQGVPARMDLLGRASHDVLGGAGCRPLSDTASGFVVCGADVGNLVLASVASVRRGDGTVVWTPAPSRDTYVMYPRLSPDGNRLAFGVYGVRSSAAFVRDRSGQLTVLPVDFYPLGWVDDAHIVGAQQDPQLSARKTLVIVTAGAPAQTVTLRNAWLPGPRHISFAGTLA